MKEYDQKDILSVLEYVKGTYGLGAFSKQGQLAALISDLAPTLKIERKLIERMDKLGILEEYVLETHSSDLIKKRLVAKSIELLTKNEFIQHEVAVEYSIVVARALGWSAEIINEFNIPQNKRAGSALSSSNITTTGASDTPTRQPYSTAAQLPHRDMPSNMPNSVSNDTVTSQPSLPTIKASINNKIKHPGWIVLSSILVLVWLILSYNELFADPSSIGFVNFVVAICLLTMLGIPVHLFTLAFADEWRTGTEKWFYWGIGILVVMLFF